MLFFVCGAQKKTRSFCCCRRKKKRGKENEIKVNFDRFADMSFGNLQNNYFFLEKKMVKTWGAETKIKRYDLFFVSSVFRGKISFFCFSFFLAII